MLKHNGKSLIHPKAKALVLSGLRSLNEIKGVNWIRQVVVRPVSERPIDKTLKTS